MTPGEFYIGCLVFAALGSVFVGWWLLREGVIKRVSLFDVIIMATLVAVPMFNALLSVILLICIVAIFIDGAGGIILFGEKE